MPKAIISDIDDTLIHAGMLMQKTYDYIQTLEGELMIVTGRPESSREETVSELEDLGISYSQLFMNDGSTADSNAFKKATAEELLKTYDVVEAIENNPDARAGYASLGIKVTDPASLPEGRDAMPSEWDGLTERQQEMATDTAELALEFGQFNQGSGPDGAHYFRDNPFAKEGVKCGNCVFFNEARNQCVVVEGEINSEAVCKLWVIPESEIMAEPANRWLKIANTIKTKIEPPRQAVIPEERGSKLETRAHSLDAELRAEMQGDKLKLTGYAAIFNSRSEDLGGFTETIAPGAFRKSLQARNDIKLLWNHDTSSPLASTRAGTLRLIEDAKGLRVEADLAPTTLGKDISILVQRGDVSAFSFGFNVIKDSWSNSGTERTLEAVRLFEASLVSFPAYTATAGTATVRALDVDQLAAGLLALENGDNLEPDLARVLKSTIDKLVIQPDVPADDGLIALKKKKLDLMILESE